MRTMHPKIQAVLNSDKDDKEKLLEIDRIIDDLILSLESEIDTLSELKKETGPELVSIHDFEPIGMFSE